MLRWNVLQCYGRLQRYEKLRKATYTKEKNENKNKNKQTLAKKGPGSRLPYVFMWLLCAAFAVFMSLVGEKELFSNEFLDFSFTICQTEGCRGNSSVFRVSLALFVFFMIHFLILFSSKYDSFHSDFLALKLFILLCIVAVMSKKKKALECVFVVLQFCFLVFFFSWDLRKQKNQGTAIQKKNKNKNKNKKGTFFCA